MAIDTTKNAYDLKLTLPYKVMSGTHLLSTGNETSNLCKSTPIDIEEPTNTVTVEMPARSLNTYIFMIDDGTAIEELTPDPSPRDGSWYDLSGRRMGDSSIINHQTPIKKGIYIRNGKKILVK